MAVFGGGSSWVAYNRTMAHAALSYNRRSQFAGNTMARWLDAALDYIPRWIEFQMRLHEQPGCVIAIAHRGRLVLEQAFGHADLARDIALTPRHRFRVASHSKSFAAASVMKLRDQDRLRLDDRAGRYVKGLHPAVARTTIAQLLSHSAGLTRDGHDSGQFNDRRPFVSRQELMAALASPPVIEPNTRFKYSNHGFGLAGLVVEAVTGEPYLAWVKREIIDAAGLDETHADMPVPRGTPVARGHSAKWPLGRRVVIPGDNRTNAIAPIIGVGETSTRPTNHRRTNQTQGINEYFRLHRMPGPVVDAINNAAQSVVDDVMRIRQHPLVPGHIPIHGYIYDVKTGRLELVASASAAGTAR